MSMKEVRINGVKMYPMNWDYAEHKLETECIRMDNKIYYLDLGMCEVDDEGFAIVTGGITPKFMEKWNALPQEVREKKLNWLRRVKDRMEEVRDLAGANVRMGSRGGLIAWMDGKTYSAAKKICAGYEALHMVFGIN